MTANKKARHSNQQPGRLVVLLGLILALALAMASCQEQISSSSSASQPEQADSLAEENRQWPQQFTLPFYPQGGTNPYLENNLLLHQAKGLLYSSLVKISPQMRLENQLAKSIQAEGQQVTVTLEEGFCFSDGSPVRLEDVEASLKAAMKSEYYGPRLANIRSSKVKEEALSITLYKPDGMFAWLLDLPILKAEELESRQPHASGPYAYQEGWLAPNEFWGDKKDQPFDKIMLEAATGTDSVTQLFKTGKISLLAPEGGVTLVGGLTPRVQTYDTGSLVFLGLNAGRMVDKGAAPLLASPEGRRALAGLFDLEEIIEQGFSGLGRQAAGPFHPLYALSAASQTMTKPEDWSQLLETLGYQQEGAGYQTRREQPLVLRILYYEGATGRQVTAELLAKQLKEFGVETQLVEAGTLEEYTAKIQAGEFELYIGEVKLYNNMDLTLFFDGGAVSSHFARSRNLLSAWEDFRKAPDQAAAFETVFIQESPYIPLLWRQGTVYTARNLQGLTPSGSDLFYDDSLLALQAD